MLKSALFRLNRIPRNMLHLAHHGLPVKICELDAVRRDNGHVAVGKKENIAGVMKNRRHIGRNKILVVAQTDHSRRSIASGDNLIRLVGRDHGKRKHSGELLYGLAHGVFQVRPLAIRWRGIFFDQMSNDFGVGLGREFVPFFGELFL